VDYKLAKLPTGLRVLTVPMPSVESVTVTVWIKVGSRWENKKNNGISHFLEHMVFKGGKKRPTAKEISEAVDSFGGQFNAATSKEWTNFYIKSRAASVETAIDVLSDMVLNPILDTTEIEKEKGVIVSEIEMYEDTPMAHIGDVFEQLIYGDDPLGMDTAGTKESVRGIKRNDFVSYRKIHYYPENILVSIAGSITEKHALSLVKKYFTHFESKNRKFVKPKKVFEQSRPQVMLQYKKTDQAHLILGFRGFGYGDKDRYAESVLSSILGGGMSNRMFTEVREKRGLAYAVKTSADHYMDNGYFGTYAGVRLDTVDEAIKVIQEEMYKIAAGDKISAREFKKAKEYMKGRTALALEDTSAVNSYFAIRAMFLDEIETPEEVYKKIDAVTVDEVYAVAKRLFDKSKLNLAIIGPYKDKGRFEKLMG
jgi:predicted Zn-dependent peptidase